MVLTTSREQAREMVTRTFFRALDKVIPSDPAVPLPVEHLPGYVNQARAVGEAVFHRLLEQHPAVEEQDGVEEDRGCARCGAD